MHYERRHVTAGSRLKRAASQSAELSARPGYGAPCRIPPRLTYPSPGVRHHSQSTHACLQCALLSRTAKRGAFVDNGRAHRLGSPPERRPGALEPLRMNRLLLTFMPASPCPPCLRAPRASRSSTRARPSTWSIGFSVGGGYDLYARHLARLHGQAHPRQSDHRAAEHAGRGLAEGGELHLHGGAEGRHLLRHLRPHHRHQSAAGKRRDLRRHQVLLARQRHRRRLASASPGTPPR